MMRISAAEELGWLPSIVKVGFAKDLMHVHLSDGRILSVPLAWYPLLAAAKLKQLKCFQISPSGYGIHWSKMDEDLSIYGFLFPGGTAHVAHNDIVVDSSSRKSRKR